jgi:hypothetical protein
MGYVPIPFRKPPNWTEEQFQRAWRRRELTMRIQGVCLFISVVIFLALVILIGWRSL